jgi:hypothetical protein
MLPLVAAAGSLVALGIGCLFARTIKKERTA